MTLVSSKEFIKNEDKYFDLAVNGNVCIQRGDNLFYLSYAPYEPQYPEQPVLAPDDDLRSAITMDELRKSAHEHIHHIGRKRIAHLVLRAVRYVTGCFFI